MPFMRNFRALLLGAMLVIGSAFGIAMRPEDIENLMHSMNQTQISQTITDERDEPEVLPRLE